jgi:mannosyltransferase OCH1-like enzyme
MKYIILIGIFIFITIIFLIISHFQGNKIPKIIHQTYPTKNINSDIQNNINNLKKLNPDYEYILYDDNDIINFIKNNYSQHILDTYNSINPEYGPARADYFRYLLIYKKGGIYLDIKSSCDRPFDSVINKNDEFILTHWGYKGAWYKILNNEYGEYCNWNIIIKKNHPLMKKIIDQITYNINNYNVKKNGVGKQSVLFLTGPIAYSKVILKNKNNYKLKIYNNYIEIGLIYNNINNYEKLFKKHYSELTSPVVYN